MGPHRQWGHIGNGATVGPQWGHRGEWTAGPLQDRASRRPLVASDGRVGWSRRMVASDGRVGWSRRMVASDGGCAGGCAQDRHDLPRSGRVLDGYYVCFSWADVPVQPRPTSPNGQETGIDLGIEAFATFATLSTGPFLMGHASSPLLPRLVSQSRARAQNRAALSTARAGYPDAGIQTQERQQAAAQGAHLARQGASESSAPTAGLSPQDRAHKTALQDRATRPRYKTALEPRTDLLYHDLMYHDLMYHDLMYHEDVQTANMLKNHHLAKRISDAGWSAFLSILAFKAVCAGKRVVAVPPAYTSHTSQRRSGCGVLAAVFWLRCSGCGVLVQKGLSVRWHSCPECGMSLHEPASACISLHQPASACISLHRDHHAAKNEEHRAARAAPSGRGWVPASQNRESVGL